MKTTLLIALIIFFAQLTFGQNAFREVANNYKNQEHFFNAELSKHTIKLYLKEKQASEDIKTVLENIENLKVLSFSITNQDLASSFLNIVDVHFNTEAYTPFKIKTTGFDQQKIYLKEAENKITRLLVIKTSLTGVSLVEINGDINLEKIALLNNALKIDGLESLNSLDENEETLAKIYTTPPKSNLQKSPDNWFPVYKFQPWNITKRNNFPIDDNNGIKVFNKYGTKLMDSQSPFILVNGYQIKTDFQSSLSEIDPACIQSINVDKKDTDLYPNGLIDIKLNGDANQLFTVCQGMLYFGQDGYLQSIKIDDECGPTLLHNCQKKPLSEIVEMQPEEIESIKLTTDPRNCEGLLEGEFVVIESK